jgi:hypothetical protein
VMFQFSGRMPHSFRVAAQNPRSIRCLAWMNASKNR